MDKLRQYADNQRNQYDATSQTYVEAKATVAPRYDHQRAVAPNYAKLMLSHYFLRHGQYYQPGQTDVGGLKLMDFGCGVGRVMEAFVELGVGAVDGCDISSAMLGHAREKAELAESKFFLTRGYDTGSSPADHYDIAYSYYCLQHIPMRQTRIKILEALARNLKPGGMVFAQLLIFPGVTAGKIPPNHAHWAENMVATRTNSAADVWITPDALGMVYDDFRLFFADITFVEMDLPAPHYDYKPQATYQFGFNEIFVVGSKGPSVCSNMLKGI